MNNTELLDQLEQKLSDITEPLQSNENWAISTPSSEISDLILTLSFKSGFEKLAEQSASSQSAERGAPEAVAPPCRDRICRVDPHRHTKRKLDERWKERMASFCDCQCVPTNSLYAAIARMTQFTSSVGDLFDEADHIEKFANVMN